MPYLNGHNLKVQQETYEQLKNAAVNAGITLDAIVRIGAQTVENRMRPGVYEWSDK